MDANPCSFPQLQPGIYSITCLPTGKAYGGQAMVVQSRWDVNRRALIAGTHGNSYLQRAWIKYGPDAFAFEIIEIVEPGRLIEREVFHAERLQAFDRKRGFNLSPIGRTHSQQALADIVERRRYEKEVDRVRRQLVRKASEKSRGMRGFVQEMIRIENFLADPEGAELAVAWDRLAVGVMRRLVVIAHAARPANCELSEARGGDASPAP
jgi:hypothetical protein